MQITLSPVLNLWSCISIELSLLLISTAANVLGSITNLLLKSLYLTTIEVVTPGLILISTVFPGINPWESPVDTFTLFLVISPVIGL